MASIFSKIISREIPGHIIAEDAHHIAFLDIMPVAWGHVLVVPKKEIDYLFHMDSQAIADLMAFAQQVATGLELVVSCRRIGVAVIGLEVPHTHIHLVPLNEVGDINFAKPKLTVPQEELAALATRLRVQLGYPETLPKGLDLA